MGTLYIDRKEAELRLDGDAIALYTKGRREGTTPIKPLKRVVLCGRLLVDTRLIHRLSEEGVSVLFLSGKRHHFRAILHGRLHKNGLLRLRQYEKATSAFAEEFARSLVVRKLEGKKLLLEEAMEERPDLRMDLKKAVDLLQGVLKRVETSSPSLDSLRGLEGGGARAYFSAYARLFPPSLGFRGRKRRPPEDPVNSLLSLTYTILHFEAVREVEVMGFDPTIGFYHTFEYGRESLACDLIEPLRPLVDRWVWELFRKRLFTSQDFRVEPCGCYLKKQGRKRYFFLYEEWAGRIRRLLADDVTCLAREVMR